MNDTLIISLITKQIAIERQMAETFEDSDWVEHFRHKYACTMLDTLLDTYTKNAKNNNKIKDRILSVLTQEDIDSLPQIHSPHEGYALMQDKIDTVMLYNALAMKIKDDLWAHITDEDIPAINNDINEIYNYLLISADKMIRLTAMCKKFVDYMEKENGKQTTD